MNKLLYVIVAIIALGFGIFIAQKANQTLPPENALFYEQARELKPFELTSHRDETFSNAELDGHWSWVFFGYTSCPDVCPTTLQEINFVYDDLKAIAGNTQVLLVSVDPLRDTTDKLSQYIQYFNQEFIALRGGHDVLFPFARNVGLMYAIVDEVEKEGYLVDHSASLVLVNPEGKIAAIFKPKHELGQLPTVSGDDLVEDFRKIVKLSSQS
jgi:protein SCO1